MISVQTARSFLGWSPDMTTGAVDQLALTLNATISQFEAGTNRIWRYHAALEQIIETQIEDERLFLILYPLTELSLEEYDNDPDDADAVDSSDYEVNLTTGVVRRVRSSSWKRFVVATIKGGFGLNGEGTSIETYEHGYDIVRAILLEVRRSIIRDAPDKITHSSISGEGGSVGLVPIAERHPEFERCIKRHRRYAKNV